MLMPFAIEYCYLGAYFTALMLYPSRRVRDAQLIGSRDVSIAPAYCRGMSYRRMKNEGSPALTDAVGLSWPHADERYRLEPIRA